MNPNFVLEQLIKAGVLGIVLAWSLWENSRDKDRLIKALENVATAMESMKSASCADVCREANR